jgi:hypothetical protein
LEEKLDGLLALLASRPRNSDSEKSEEDTFHDDTTLRTSEEPSRSNRSELEQTTTPTDPLSEPAMTATDFDNRHDPDIIDQGLLTQDQAQLLLETFRQKCTVHFPFVVVPPETTTSSLRRNAPFLFLAIMSAMSYDNTLLQKYLVREITSQVSEKIVMKGEKSLQLLQGLLVHVAWYHHVFDPQKQQLVLFTQLCVTLVHELGLDRNPKISKRRRTPLNPGVVAIEKSSSKTPAQNRALLGAYYISSV